jgi:hypothetical protein
LEIIASNLFTIRASSEHLDLVEVEIEVEFRKMGELVCRSSILVGAADSGWKEKEDILTVRVP